MINFLSVRTALAQCPSNIDFEQGNFNGWTCYNGYVDVINGQNTMVLSTTSGPIFNKHTLYSRDIDGAAKDPFGNFPVVCPNGSNYSVRLGNSFALAEAEGLSYEFTIPPDKDHYSLTYHYAVVFQDPGHASFQQPRLDIEVMNVTDNEVIACSSFTFFANGSPLPGFFESPLSGNVPVLCKNWSAVAIKLNGKAGKTIRLFFKTADCTFKAHFGYAYIDVNTECSSELLGAAYCADDTAVNVNGPSGYMEYKWFNSNFTQVLGTQQVLHLSPLPVSGSTLALELIPFDGYGCIDTVYVSLQDTATLTANAGPDISLCTTEPVRIGGLPRQDVVYEWSPAAGLSDITIANPRANPLVTTKYALSVRSKGGGCYDTDTVLVSVDRIDTAMQLTGKTLFCNSSDDSAVLEVQPANRIQWYKDNAAIAGATNTKYKVLQSGKYHAVMYTAGGCSASTREQQIEIEIQRPAINYPLKYAFINNPLALQARTFGNAFLWKPSIYLDGTITAKPVFKRPETGDQLYTIDISTPAGCLTVDTQLVKTVKEIKVYVPTAFTPDGNGLNDRLSPVLIGIKEVTYFKVWSRWGQLVYDMKNEPAGWDGTFHGAKQPAGVFVWVFSGIGANDEVFTSKGTITLMR